MLWDPPPPNPPPAPAPYINVIPPVRPPLDPFSWLDCSSDSLTLCGVTLFGDEDLWFLNYSHFKHVKIVGCNGLTDQVLSYLPSTLVSLTIIDCQHFSDRGIASLHGLLHLETLTLEGCQGIEGLSFGSLPLSLKTLNLLSCPWISDRALSTLTPLNLTRLTIFRSQNLQGSTLGALPSSLKTLQLEDCPYLVDKSLENLTFLSHLTTLSLAFSPHIHGTTLEYLPASLKTLSLEGCLSLTDLSSLASLHSLRSLNLSKTRITDIYLPLLCKLKLNRLIINDCSLSSSSLERLSKRLDLPIKEKFHSHKEKGICSNLHCH